MADFNKSRTKNSKSRNSKNSNRKLRNDSKEWEDRSKMDKCNDPEWYVRSPQLAKDVASISFNNALGSRFSLNVDNAIGDWNTASYETTLPGIMAINTVPAVGYSTGGYSPVNIAARAFFAELRKANSGAKNYDSPDMLLYFLSVDSLYSIIMHLQRCYGVAQTYSQVNRYVGDGMMYAMGFDPDNVRANLAQFRSSINMLIVKACAFAVPKSMSLFKRHAWMYSGIFKDHDISKCQFYLYRPVGAHKYVETSGGPGYGQLMPCGVEVGESTSSGEFVSSTTWTVSQWISYAEDLLSALVKSEDIATMSGDVLKAFGRENTFSLSLIGDDYAITPVYSEEILDQIHNTIFAGSRPRTITDLTDTNQISKVNWSSFNLNQDPNVQGGDILFAPQVARARQLSVDHFLDMYDDNPDPSRVLVATRNMLHGITTVLPSGSYTVSTIDCCGSDIAMWADIVDYQNGADGQWILARNAYFSLDGSQTSIIPNLPDYTAFHRAPLGYTFNTTTGGFNVVLGEMDNFTKVSSGTLAKMHESAILSMLNVPV